MGEGTEGTEGTEGADGADGADGIVKDFTRGVDGFRWGAYTDFVLRLVKAVGKWLMVLSLCGAVGLHWAALQSIAWAGMLLNYSRGGSVTSAIEKTFDGRHPCPLCNAINKAQQEGGKKPELQLTAKIDMDLPRQAALLIPPLFDFSWPVFAPAGCGFSPEPSVPPPRAA